MSYSAVRFETHISTLSQHYCGRDAARSSAIDTLAALELLRASFTPSQRLKRIRAALALDRFGPLNNLFDFVILVI